LFCFRKVIFLLVTQGAPILKEVICPVVLRPEQKLVLQHGDIAVAVLRDLESGKVEGAPAPFAAEAPHTMTLAGCFTFLMV
jgi:hypothetical protein